MSHVVVVEPLKGSKVNESTSGQKPWPTQNGVLARIVHMLARIVRILLNAVCIVVSLFVATCTGGEASAIYADLYINSLGISLGPGEVFKDLGMGMMRFATACLVLVEVLPFACFSFLKAIKYLLHKHYISSIWYCALTPISALIAIILAALPILFAILVPEMFPVAFFIVFPFVFFLMKRIFRTNFDKKVFQE
jgi:hypothetical protein